MVFRRDNKSGDAFQRQMSALRQQLGESGSTETPADDDSAAYGAYDDTPAASSPPASGLGDAVARADDYRSYRAGTGAVYENQSVTGSIVPTAPEVPELPDIDPETTVIAHNTTWKGEISSEGTVHVHGRFEGSLTARDEILIADGADVDARINAATVTVGGNVKGTLRCESRFEVLPTGRVSADVLAPTIVVHEGAIIAGRIRMNMSEAATTTESEPTPTPAPESPVPVIQRRVNRGSA